jgi:hypothetical protein
LDGFGGIHVFRQGRNSARGPVPGRVRGAPYWTGWDIARGIAVLPDGSGGYVLDGFGGLHPFRIGNGTMPPTITDAPYWNGWDIARGVSILPDGSGGYVLDGYNALHPFTIHGPKPSLPNPYRLRYGADFSTSTGITTPFLQSGRTGGWITDVYGDVFSYGTVGDRVVSLVIPEGFPAPGQHTRGIAGFTTGFGGVTLDGDGTLHLFSAGGAA